MSDFIQLVYSWYNINKRDLPWRETKDPYKIWISEIILQQTRVDQGLKYYQKFIEAFPSVETLASASEDQVLKLWQGLGYYSRARNLHESAKTIAQKHQGIFPQSYSEILALKGIGPYTAAAIASIAYNLPHPVLDGNVYRLMARYFGINLPIDSVKGKKAFHGIAAEIISHSNPGFHNEALMEFGALQCIPRSPDCISCPLATSCFAFNNKRVELLPVKEKKLVRRIRYFYFYLIETKNYIWLEKRTGNDIWKNLYQFPAAETENELSEEEVSLYHPPFLKDISYTLVSVSSLQKHILSHQTLFARLIHLQLDDNDQIPGHYMKVHRNDIHTYPVPRLMEQLTEKIKIFIF